MSPAQAEQDGRTKAHRARDGDHRRGPDELSRRAADQDAQALCSQQARLRQAEGERAAGVGHTLHERRRGGELVAAAEPGQHPQREDDGERWLRGAADKRCAGQDGKPAHHPQPPGWPDEAAEYQRADDRSDWYGGHQQADGHRAAAEGVRIWRGESLR